MSVKCKVSVESFFKEKPQAHRQYNLIISESGVFYNYFFNRDLLVLKLLYSTVTNFLRPILGTLIHKLHLLNISQDFLWHTLRCLKRLTLKLQTRQVTLSIVLVHMVMVSFKLSNESLSVPLTTSTQTQSRMKYQSVWTLQSQKLKFLDQFWLEKLRKTNARGRSYCGKIWRQNWKKKTRTEELRSVATSDSKLNPPSYFPSCSGAKPCNIFSFFNA